MTYWIVFALWTLGEEVVDLVLAFWWPLYWECKVLTSSEQSLRCSTRPGCFSGCCFPPREAPPSSIAGSSTPRLSPKKRRSMQRLTGFGSFRSTQY